MIHRRIGVNVALPPAFSAGIHHGRGDGAGGGRHPATGGYTTWGVKAWRARRRLGLLRRSHDSHGRTRPSGGRRRVVGLGGPRSRGSAGLVTNWALRGRLDGHDFARTNDFAPNAAKFHVWGPDQDRDFWTPALTSRRGLATQSARLYLQGILERPWRMEWYRGPGGRRPGQGLPGGRSGGLHPATGGNTSLECDPLGCPCIITDILEHRVRGGIIGDVAGGDPTDCRDPLTSQTFAAAMITTIVVPGEPAAVAGPVWRSVKLDSFSDDRNVSVANEIEAAYTGGQDVNACRTPRNCWASRPQEEWRREPAARV